MISITYIPLKSSKFSTVNLRMQALKEDQDPDQWFLTFSAAHNSRLFKCALEPPEKTVLFLFMCAV